MQCGEPAGIQWSYRGNPAASPADALRFTVGDTNDQQPLLSDGEVDYLLMMYDNNVRLAAISALESLIAKVSGTAVDESVGAVSIQFSQRLSNLQLVLDMLREREALGGGFVPFLGGVYRSGKQASATDASIVQPYFKTHTHTTRDPDDRGGMFERAPARLVE